MLVGCKIKTWNRYAYVANNPVSFLDPTGTNLEARNQGSLGGGGGACDPNFDAGCDPSYGIPGYCSPEVEGDCNDPGVPIIPVGVGGGGGGTGGGGVPTRGGGGSGRPQAPWQERGIFGLPPSVYQGPLNLGSLLGLNPTVCDFGVCNPIGNGFLDPEDTSEVILAGCGVQPEACPAIFLISITVYAGVVYGPQIVDTIKQMAKGGPQNIPPSWVTDRPLPGESADAFARRVCTARYGSVAGCGSGPGSEFNKIKKWAQEWINKHG